MLSTRQPQPKQSNKRRVVFRLDIRGSTLDLIALDFSPSLLVESRAVMIEPVRTTFQNTRFLARLVALCIIVCLVAISSADAAEAGRAKRGRPARDPDGTFDSGINKRAGSLMERRFVFAQSRD